MIHIRWNICWFGDEEWFEVSAIVGELKLAKLRVTEDKVEMIIFLDLNIKTSFQK
ncbi:MAG: hypothetical protein E6890_05110 [Staphylococcus epidermidis]|nr:hypothetical protein [Staphylococcus epidermidis]